MTVIAYTKGILAADSRATDDDGLVLKTTKLYELPNGSFCGAAGDADVRDVLAILGRKTWTSSINHSCASGVGRTPIKLPSRASLIKTKTNCTILWVFPNGDKVYRVQIENNSTDNSDSGWGAEVLEIEDGYAAVGSGSAYALGAMVSGKTAVEAVRAACKLDVNCGLPLNFLKVK